MDPEADRRLKRDGFVKVRVLEPHVAAALRARYESLGPAEGAGFISDFVRTDLDYRRAADDAIADVLDAPSRALFTTHEPFMHNFLCKYPGSDSSLYLHRDWMYVDERAGDRTYAVWVALEDITGDNGQLRVLRGSHEIERDLRGTDLVASWIDQADVLEPRLLSVPVAAGEGLVFDNGLVHSSYPNHTERPRLAAAVGMRPTGVPLVHFRRIEAHRAVRYDVTAEFFLEETPQGLMAEAPLLDPAEEIHLPASTIDRGELVRRLDRGALARIDRVRQASNRGMRRSGAALRVGGARIGAAWSELRSRRPDRRLIPTAAETRARISRAVAELPSQAAIAVLGMNEMLIDRFGPDHPSVWDPAQFDWSARIEAGYPDIRAEVEALLAGPTEIPHIEDVTGGIPQGNVGPWRSFVLMHQGRWIDWNCARCPATTELVRTVPGLSMAGFSVLEPGTHITSHRGPNKGALRHQLGVIVPGSEGDCRIRVGDEMLHWCEGESVMFDFTTLHEAWNDTDRTRVLLMLEVLTPLPWYLDLPNRLAQRTMAWFPTTRDMTRRLRALEPTLLRDPQVA